MLKFTLIILSCVGLCVATNVTMNKKTQREFIAEHCKFQTALAMELYSELKANPTQRDQLTVWEQSIYYRLTKMMRAGQLSHRIQDQFYNDCKTNYV